MITGSSGDIDVAISYVDFVSGAATPGSTATANVTTATTTPLVAGISTGVRNIKLLSIRNSHASTSNSIEVTMTDGSTAITIYKITLLAGEQIVYGDNGWVKLSAGGLPQGASSGGPVDIQTFTSNGTWTKPTGFTPSVVFVKMWGAGGGGGAGASLATATIAKGGAGGGGGAFVREAYLASDLPSTVSVTVGTGGSAGTPGAAGAAGGAGGIGGSTSFGTYATAYGGGGGAGGAISGAASGGGGGGGTGSAGTSGTTAVGQGGNPGVNGAKGVTGVGGGTGSDGPITVVTTHNAEFGGGGGGGSTATPTSCVGGGSLFGGGGGGTGGHHNATPAIVAGTAGAWAVPMRRARAQRRAPTARAQRPAATAQTATARRAVVAAAAAARP